MLATERSIAALEGIASTPQAGRNDSPFRITIFPHSTIQQINHSPRTRLTNNEYTNNG